MNKQLREIRLLSTETTDQSELSSSLICMYFAVHQSQAISLVDECTDQIMIKSDHLILMLPSGQP